jgi:uncharacterized membrane protein (DUF373 family)
MQLPDFLSAAAATKSIYLKFVLFFTGIFTVLVLISLFSVFSVYAKSSFFVKISKK